MTSSQATDTEADEEQEEQAPATKTEDADAAAEEAGEPSESEPAAELEGDDAPEGAGGQAAGTTRGDLSRVAAGAAAVLGAGLGIASLTGTWISDLMSSRQELIGQIQGQNAPPDEQIATIYGTPWHTTALFNGIFALAAIIVAGAALVIPAFRKTGDESPTWVRAVAFGGIALGTVGLAIAAAMWFDVFTELPTVPEQPAIPG